MRKKTFSDLVAIEMSREATAAMKRVISQLRKALKQNDTKAMEDAEEKASRIDITIVDSEVFSEYDELYSEAFKLLMK